MVFICRENPSRSGILLFLDRPRFCRLMKTQIPDHLGWSGTNRENRKRFYFPDASQISAMIGDFSDMSAKSETVGKQQNHNKIPRLLAVPFQSVERASESRKQAWRN